MPLSKLCVIIAKTPLWVWPLFAYLLINGFKALYARTVPWYSVALFPLILLVLQIRTLTAALYEYGVFYLLGWLLAFGVAAGVGYALFSSRDVIAHRKQGTITIPGSPLILILVLVIFCTRYVFGYLAAVQPELCATPGFTLLQLLVGGIFGGLFFGRMACYLSSYYAA